MNTVTLLRTLCAVLCLLPWIAEGITLGDGERTGVTLAQGAVNQLRVTADRIETLRGIPTEVEVTLDPLLGDAYLTVKGEKPFTAFITTEKKRRYVLDCLPLLDIPAKVIVIEAPLVIPATSPPSIQQSEVMAFLHELREKINMLPSKKRSFMLQEIPKRRMATRVLLVEKQHGVLVGKVYWVKSLKDLPKETSGTDSLLARVISPASRVLHPTFYVVEVAYV